MRKNKIILFVVIAALAFSLCACANTALHPEIARSGAAASADLTLPESVKIEAATEEACVYSLAALDEEAAKAQAERCFDINLDAAEKDVCETSNYYKTDEYYFMYDKENGYWICSNLQEKKPAAGDSMSDEEALKIAKEFVVENELWYEEISDVKVVDETGIDENYEPCVLKKSVYFFPTVNGKTVLGMFRICVDINPDGEISAVFCEVNSLGEATQASLKSRADIAADVEARNYSASFSQDLTDAKINDCKLCYYADGVENGGKTYLYPVYVLMGEGKAADGSTETFDLIIDAQK